MRDGSGLSLTLMGDTRVKPQGLSALAVLDDRAELSPVTAMRIDGAGRHG